VQRRHQKLLEEAPAPALAPEVTSAMGDAAIRVARACGYVNAGTVEMIYQDGEFFFLEMNTRLQVEHPVTEMVTGIDLVGLQLAVAAGAELPFSQEQVQLRGHAMEARVNAEDPAGGRFTPSPGPISRLRPATGPWVRTDSGYEAGDDVSQFYDNLVAKVVAWGPDRESARRRLLRALWEFEVEGVATNIAAHVAVLTHEDFISVSHSTSWLAGHVDLAAIAPAPPPGLSAPAPGPKAIGVEVDDRYYEVRVWLPPGYQPGPGGAPEPGSGRDGGTGPGGDGPGGEVAAPMQGTIVQVLVKPGDSVDVGQVLFVLEAMKMENNIASAATGTVLEVRAQPGASVGTGDVIVVLGRN
jgi:acetyl-CoA/propionyl-CoA carboxylase biotin carboxyl carrier protein